MTDITIDPKTDAYHGRGAPHLSEKSSPWAIWIFFGVLAIGFAGAALLTVILSAIRWRRPPSGYS